MHNVKSSGQLLNKANIMINLRNLYKLYQMKLNNDVIMYKLAGEIENND